MTYRIGDSLFTQNGHPATVVGRNDEQGTVKYDKDYKAFQVSTRHGLINGMAPETREVFNAIMDEAKEEQDNDKRVESLRQKIDELKLDPKHFKLVQYLEGEVQHLMSVKGVKPRFFSTEEFKLR